jgi:phospholipid/cholesterol/gamma-HCH transport system substrate-binding protein
MKKYSMETVVGIFVVIGLICVAYMTVKLGKISYFGDSHYSIYANFGSVSGLRAGNIIEIHGIEVGRVSSLDIDQEKQAATVELKIRKDIKLYDDASASIKIAGLIGDKFINIDPGGSGALLMPGDRISETTSPIDIGDMISKYAFGDIKTGAKKEAK